MSESRHIDPTTVFDDAESTELMLAPELARWRFPGGRFATVDLVECPLWVDGRVIGVMNGHVRAMLVPDGDKSMHAIAWRKDRPVGYILSAGHWRTK